MKFAAIVLATLSTFAAVQGTPEEDYAKCVMYVYGDTFDVTAFDTPAKQCDYAGVMAHCGKKAGAASVKTQCEAYVGLLTDCAADCSGAFSIKTGILATTALALLTSVVGLSL